MLFKKTVVLNATKRNEMTTLTSSQAIYQNFLGEAPNWFKNSIIFFLILNPILLFSVGPYYWMDFNS